MNWTSSGIIVLAECYSTHTVPRKLLNRLEVARQYTIMFFNRNVLVMPVPAGIFAMNKLKSIANIHKLLEMWANPSIEGQSQGRITS